MKNLYLLNLIIQKLLSNLLQLVEIGLIKPANNVIHYLRNQFVNEKMVHQIGGYQALDNSVASTKRKDAEQHLSSKRLKVSNLKRKAEFEISRVSKKQRLNKDIDYYIEELFQLVDVEYILTFITIFTDEERFHRQKGFLRNVTKLAVRGELEKIGKSFCNKQLYDTRVEKVDFKTKPVPDEPVELVHQRMYGVAINYHYLRVEPNDSATNECVFQYLLSNYQRYYKKLTKEYLMELFQIKDSTQGVSTGEIIKFCEKFKIPLYALDLEMKVFHHYKPAKASHKYPSLVYVCCNSHLYPIEEESVRNSLFATERERESKSGVSIYNKKTTNRFFNGNQVILNPEFKDICKLKNANVIYDNMSNLLELVLYFFKIENTIYRVESFNSNINRIEYKDGVYIYVNEDYQLSVNNCNALSIPFKNQNHITLGKELFEIHTERDKLYSTFNTQVRNVFLNYEKGPFSFSKSIPPYSDDLIAFDVKKCYSAALSIDNH